MCIERCIDCAKAIRVHSPWTGEFRSQVKIIVSDDGRDLILRECLEDDDKQVDDVANLDSVCETGKFEPVTISA